MFTEIFQVAPATALHGALRVPGDKSISHRSVMLAAIAEGESEIRGFLPGEDNRNTLNAFKAMGVPVMEYSDTHLKIQGLGREGLQAPAAALDMGNSGTAMRLLTGLLSAQTFDSVLIGDRSLSKRPMRRVIDPLTQMGARIEATPAGTAPLQIFGGQKLKAIEYTMPVASAQVKSALLLAGLYAEGETVIHEPAVTRDHSERMLRAFGYAVATNGNRIALRGGGRLQATAITIPADISSATFFLVGAAIARDAEVLLTEVGLNPTRIGIINILQAMGADLTLLNPRQLGDEPVADLLIKGGKPLRGLDIPKAWVPLAIDEFPAIFIAAACAEGETRLSGAEELRVKESDRIAVMAQGLQTLGVRSEVLADGLIIQGDKDRRFSGGRIDSHGDHRIAMAFAMASLRAEAPMTLHDCAAVATSFPGFVTLATAAGLHITVQHDGD
jgi:3-phosphoshikimate 1-carboxyvinyltransferase